MKTISFTMRVVILAFGLLCIQASTVMAQDMSSDDPEERTAADRFGGVSRTRFGRELIDRMPDKIEYANPRFSGGFWFGRNNSFLGIDTDDPSSRFRDTGDTPQLLPSDYLSEKPPVKRRAEVGSVNRPLPADMAGSQPTSIRRPTGFFDRPGVMEPTPVGSGESSIRDPRRQRWFRDLGQQPMSGTSGERGSSMNGLATAVGGSEGPEEPRPSLHSGQKRALQPNPAESKRRYEEKLEGMLLTHPTIHLLSPVNVSFENGIATVRGVVPSKTHKVAAGNLLLSDPAVKQVNNLITVVPADPNQVLPPIDPR